MNQPQLKTCTGCKVTKLFSDFHKNQRRCIDCKKTYAEQHKEHKRIRDSIYYKEKLIHRRSLIKNRMISLATSAKCRSLKNGIPYNLDGKFLYSLLVIQNFKCAQTGIDFDFSMGHGKKRLLKSPSIDRRNPEKGYTFENIQIVCLFYNMAKNNATDSELWNLMEQAVQNKVAKT